MVLDITYIPMAKGFLLYLAVIMDWVSRAVLAWRLSNTLGTEFCVDALEEALSEHGRPEIFNTDQGSQFTSDGFTGTLEAHDVTISMDGKGRCMDNIFVERLWRSLEIRRGLPPCLLRGRWPRRRPALAPGSASTMMSVSTRASAIAHRDEFTRKACGYVDHRLRRPAVLPPASRASSESGEMLAFAHIPTGTTASKGIDIDDLESGRVAPAVAVTAIGAEIEIGRATP